MAVSWNLIAIIAVIVALVIIFFVQNNRVKSIAYIVLGVILVWWGILNVITGTQLFNIPDLPVY